MLCTLLVLGLALAAPADTPSSADPDREVQDAVLRHLYFREVYSGVVRDGLQGMRLDPLPFTKRLPSDAPPVDMWEGAGYEQDTVLTDPVSDPTGRLAIAAGVCAPNEDPCQFFIAYLFAVNKSYVTTKPDQLAIRYIVRKSGTQPTEGFMWGSEADPHHYLRDGGAWRRVSDSREQTRMNRAVELANGEHKKRLLELEKAGRIIRQ